MNAASLPSVSAGRLGRAESRLRFILAEAGFPAPALCPTPEAPDPADPETSSLWFPEERTVLDFEPRFPFWCDEFEPDEDEPPAPAPISDPTAPQPVERCWISWADLNDPPAVIDRVRATFTRASRRTGVRQFHLARART